MSTRFYDKLTDIQELEGWSTVPQVAERCGVSRQRVNQWVLEGKFPAVHRISEIILIPEGDIDEFEMIRAGNPIKYNKKTQSESSYR